MGVNKKKREISEKPVSGPKSNLRPHRYEAVVQTIEAKLNPAEILYTPNTKFLRNRFGGFVD
jgi:hypothetical protein